MKVGIDIVDLKKFKDSLVSGQDTMLEKIFTKSELSKVRKVNKLAGIFAAKESFIKAVSNKKIKMNEIEIGYNKHGKPVLVKPKNYISDHKVEFSIAHDGNYAVSICIIA